MIKHWNNTITKKGEITKVLSQKEILWARKGLAWILTGGSEAAANISNRDQQNKKRKLFIHIFSLLRVTYFFVFSFRISSTQSGPFSKLQNLIFLLSLFLLLRLHNKSHTNNHCDKDAREQRRKHFMLLSRCVMHDIPYIIRWSFYFLAWDNVALLLRNVGRCLF